jgi:hypothetical protein
MDLCSMLEAGPDGIHGGMWPSPPNERPFVQRFVAVPDVAACVAQASALGATVVIPPSMLPDGDAMAVIATPSGLSIGLCTLRSPTQSTDEVIVDRSAWTTADARPVSLADPFDSQTSVRQTQGLLNTFTEIFTMLGVAILSIYFMLTMEIEKLSNPVGVLIALALALGSVCVAARNYSKRRRGF